MHQARLLLADGRLLRRTGQRRPAIERLQQASATYQVLRAQPFLAQVAAELFISRKAIEYHLGNIYAKYGLHGRQELRRFVEQWGRPAAA